MTTTVDKITEVLLDKVLTKEDLDKLANKLKPVFLAELEKNLIKVSKDFIDEELLRDALDDRALDFANDLVNQVTVSLSLKKPKAKKKITKK